MFHQGCSGSRKRYVPTGHGLELQDVESISEPGHVFPPLAGDGLSHFLALFWLPPPQDFEQVVQLPHGPQLPSERDR